MYDQFARNLAEVIEDLYRNGQVEIRDRNRRIELIDHHIRRAIREGVRREKARQRGGTTERFSLDDF